jgi:hypothetical protein
MSAPVGVHLFLINSGRCKWHTSVLGVLQQQSGADEQEDFIAPSAAFRSETEIILHLYNS